MYKILHLPTATYIYNDTNLCGGETKSDRFYSEYEKEEIYEDLEYKLTDLFNNKKVLNKIKDIVKEDPYYFKFYSKDEGINKSLPTHFELVEIKD